MLPSFRADELWIPNDSVFVFVFQMGFMSITVQLPIVDKYYIVSSFKTFLFLLNSFPEVTNIFTMLKPQWLLHFVVEMNQKGLWGHLKSFYPGVSMVYVVFLCHLRNWFMTSIPSQLAWVEIISSPNLRSEKDSNPLPHKKKTLGINMGVTLR